MLKKMMTQMLAETEHDDEIPNESVLFDCPEPNCIRKYQFYGNLIRHLAGGKHQYKPERETMQDVVQSMFKKKLETIYTATDEVHSFMIDESQARTSQCVASQHPLQRGWALGEPTVNVRFNRNQVSWLNEKFDHGKVTGHKFHAGELAKTVAFVTKPGSNGIVKYLLYLLAP